MELSSVQSNYISVTLKQKTYLICQSFCLVLKSVVIGWLTASNASQTWPELEGQFFNRKKCVWHLSTFLNYIQNMAPFWINFSNFIFIKSLTAKQVPTEMVKDSIKSSKFASNRENICVRTHTQLRHHNSHFIYQRTYFLHAGSECRIQNAKI